MAEVDDYIEFMTPDTGHRYRIAPKMKNTGVSYIRQLYLEMINMGTQTVLIPDTASDRNTLVMIAHACHERNRQVCIQNGEENVAPVWEEYDDELKETTINGVIFTLEKLRENELRERPIPLNHIIPQQAKDNHINWMKDKVKAGWVYGEVKDFDKKTHPCMVDYDKLPKVQQMKDFVFIAEVVHHYMSLQSDVFGVRNINKGIAGLLS